MSRYMIHERNAVGVASECIDVPASHWRVNSWSRRPSLRRFKGILVVLEPSTRKPETLVR
jgi:hypothetical protein